MSVASTRPPGPTRRAARIVCPPAPAATSSTRPPVPTRGIQHPLGGLAEPELEGRPPAAPCAGRLLPLLAGGDLVLLRIEGGHGDLQVSSVPLSNLEAPEPSPVRQIRL